MRKIFSPLHNSYICAVCPNLSRCFTIHPPLKDVLTWGEVRHQDRVHHTHTSPGWRLVTGAESRVTRLVTGRAEGGVGCVVTRGAVTAWSAWTGLASSSGSGVQQMHYKLLRKNYTDYQNIFDTCSYHWGISEELDSLPTLNLLVELPQWQTFPWWTAWSHCSTAEPAWSCRTSEGSWQNTPPWAPPGQNKDDIGILLHDWQLSARWPRLTLPTSRL